MAKKFTQFSELTGTFAADADDFVPIIDVSEPVAADRLKKIRVRNLRRVFCDYPISPGAQFNYFGTGVDGSFVANGSNNFSSTEDGPVVVRNFTSLEVPPNVVLTTTLRCQGLLIFVDGDAVINGTLTMKGRGCKTPGLTTSNDSFARDFSAAKVLGLQAHGISGMWADMLFAYAPIPAYGGAGGAGNSAGAAGVNGGTGGGGGGATAVGTGGSGSQGTAFCGGSGGGGGGTAVTTGNPVSGGSAAPEGGQGGAGGGSLNIGGGGAGNPNGANGTIRENGCGGVLILVVRGNLTVGSVGSINANGSNGNDNTGGDGGASGGGRVIIFYGGALTNNGSITADGGTIGPDGGAGSVTVKQIAI